MNTRNTIAMPVYVNAANAIQVMAQADCYFSLGAAALVPEYEADAAALKARVIGELSAQPRYAGQTKQSERGEARLVPVQSSALAQMVARIMRAVAAAASPTDAAAEGAAKAEEIEIPEELRRAAEKLAKLAAKYEKARSLANRALSAAFAAK